MSTTSSSSAAEARRALLSLIAEEIASPVAEPIAAVAAAIRDRHADAALGLLFYGSALRDASETNLFGGVLDFYLLVDDYRRAYRSGGLALTNRLLPPNVFYLETDWQGRRLRAKYAVISLDQFCRRNAPGTADPYLWARFCQPARLLLASGERVRERVVDALGDAVLAFVDAALPLVGANFAARELWVVGFAATYGTELRAESGGRPDAIYEFDHARYDRLLAPALAALEAAAPPDADGRYRRALGRAGGAGSWRVRRRLGRLLHLLRLAKGTFTFEGGVDYILWKIERHTGRRPPMSDWERRHPLLAAPILLVRFYRAGAFR